jgi:hypothetical protein
LRHNIWRKYWRFSTRSAANCSANLNQNIGFKERLPTLSPTTVLLTLTAVGKTRFSLNIAIGGWSGKAYFQQLRVGWKVS